MFEKFNVPDDQGFHPQDVQASGFDSFECKSGTLWSITVAPPLLHRTARPGGEAISKKALTMTSGKKTGREHIIMSGMVHRVENSVRALGG